MAKAGLPSFDKGSGFGVASGTRSTSTGGGGTDLPGGVDVHALSAAMTTASTVEGFHQAEMQIDKC